VGELILDRARRRVVCEDVPIPLSPLEFDLLAYLTQHRRVVSYEELLTHVWRCAADSGTPQLVRMAVSRLRAKLGQGGCCYPGIENVRGIGYRLSSHPGRN
jgi:DNA-binding response OmpR family regulator